MNSKKGWKREREERGDNVITRRRRGKTGWDKWTWEAVQDGITTTRDKTVCDKWTGKIRQGIKRSGRGKVDG